MAFFHSRKTAEPYKILSENTIDASLPLRADHNLRETPKNAVIRGGFTSLNKTQEEFASAKQSNVNRNNSFPITALLHRASSSSRRGCDIWSFVEAKKKAHAICYKY